MPMSGTTLPPDTDYTGSSRTQGQKKTFMSALRAVVDDINNVLYGIPGVTDGSSASTGKVGETLEDYVANINIGISWTHMTSITLTAGDWDIFASIVCVSSGAVAGGLALGTTIASNTLSGLVVPAAAVYGKTYTLFAIDTGGNGGSGNLNFRISITGASKLIYLSASSTTTGKLMHGYLWARRVR